MISEITSAIPNFDYQGIVFTRSEHNINHYDGEGLLALSPNISVRVVLKVDYNYVNRTINLWFTINNTKLKGNLMLEANYNNEDYSRFAIREIICHIRSEFITELIKSH